MPALLIASLVGFAFALSGGVPDSITEEQRAELAKHFGFGPMQIYKLKRGLEQLRIADLDADGRNDLILWNGWQNRLELFYQPNEEDSASDQADLERNELPDRGDMRIEHLPVAYRVASLAVAELTGDDRPDIVFFGEPKELVILPGKPAGGFGPAAGIRAPDGDPRGLMLATGDFNHDGRADAALLGPEILLLFYQKTNGGLATPERFVHTLRKTLMMLTADVNGDDRDDLVIAVDDDEYGLVCLLQTAEGKLGGMRRMRVPKVRSVTIVPENDGPDTLLCVESATGRLKEYRWATEPDTAGEPDWPMEMFSYPVSGRSSDRPIAMGDVTGDGLDDVVVVDPKSAQMVLFIGAAHGLEPPIAFPGRREPIDVQIADYDHDGVNEVITLSREEKVVAISKYEDGRLTFPTPTPFGGEPLALAAGRAGGDQDEPLIAYLAEFENKDAEDAKDEAQIRLELHRVTADEIRAAWEVTDLDEDPLGMRFADVNQDGRTDLLVFVQFANLIAYLQAEDGAYARMEGAGARSGLVADATPRDFALLDVDGDGRDEVILVQKNLARALRVVDGAWTVVDQFNPDRSDTSLSGIATVGAGDEARIVTFDRTARDLLVFARRDDGTFTVRKRMPIGAFEPRALFAPTAQQVIFAGGEKLARFDVGELGDGFVEQQAFETDIKDGWLADAAVGDVNGDGVRDIVTVEMRKAHLELLTTLPDGAFVKTMQFRVFQGKRFSDEPDRGGEPREVIVGDVTNDRKDDIAVIVHDRVIVYPGE